MYVNRHEDVLWWRRWWWCCRVVMELVGLSLRFEVCVCCCVVEVLVESQEVQRETEFGWTASWRFDGGQRKYKSNPTENGWMVAGRMS